jgi:hypothetical protein
MYNPSRLSILLISIVLFTSCSLERDLDKNLTKLDELYGVCDNPQRDLSKGQYKICKDKERAGSGNPLTADTITDLVLKSLPNNIGVNGNVVSATNSQLWQASLKTLEQYPIKIADFNGGFIESEWIVDNDKNQRCLIKIQIKSPELISNGVDAKFICQNKKDGLWMDDNIDYTEESKQLILAILKNTNF